MDNIAGSPVEGDNFFGRDAEVARFQEMLRHHDVLLLGPRRIGKTSLARAVLKAVEGHGWQAVEINVASCRDERGFVERLTKGIEMRARSLPAQVWAGLASRLGSLATRIESLQVSMPGVAGGSVRLRDAPLEDWTTVANDSLRLMAEGAHTWLIYVDELPIFLYQLLADDPADGAQRVRRFLDWFRNDVRGLPECRHVRWLVTGSVGLDTLVQRHRMADTINSLKHEALDPFDDDTAVAMIERLAASYRLALDTDGARALVEAVRWPQPYYLQLVFNRLRQLEASTRRPPGGLIADAIERSVQPGEDNDYHHWEQRLSLQLGVGDASHAVALLTVAAQDADGARAEALYDRLRQRMPDDGEDAQRSRFVELRDILVRDGYWGLHEAGGARRYRFRLELLRLWWLRRHRL